MKTTKYDLHEAPLPWWIAPSTLFESEVRSAPFSETNRAQTIIFQGPKSIAQFIVDVANNAAETDADVDAEAEVEAEFAGLLNVSVGEVTELNMTEWTNHYVHCGKVWNDSWSCWVDDECSVCGHDIEPFMSQDSEGGVIVFVQPNFVPENGWPTGVSSLAELKDMALNNSGSNDSESNESCDEKATHESSNELQQPS